MEKVKVISLEIENVKRVQAVQIVPTATGLTVIGGKNRQGKSSVLDAICSALGGAKFNPSNAIRDGEKRGTVTVQLSNGITAKRIFTPGGSRLEIAGNSDKSGQALLDSFISVFALDLSKFLQASDKDKATTLLQIIGVDLQPYEEKEQKLFQERENIGRLKRKAQGHAESLPYDEEAGNELHTTESLMNELQDVVSHNAQNREIRRNAEQAKQNVSAKEQEVESAKARVDDLKARLKEAEQTLEQKSDELAELQIRVKGAEDKTLDLEDKDESDIRKKLSDIESLNNRIRQNLEREKAFAEVEGYGSEYTSLTGQIEQVRSERKALLEGADMPLDGLSVEGGVLTYQGKAWDCMSHAEQLIAATAICQKTNPDMGFVLVDKLEAMDTDTLEEYRAWLESEGLQAITTRVSTGGECSLIIEDGQIAGQAKVDTAEPEQAKTEQYTF